LPLLTVMVPAVTKLIAPISDRIVNQIDLDNNTITQSGVMRSSEMAKQEMIRSWNAVTERLFVDMLDGTTPPFSIAAGTRITVFSPRDLVVVWCDDVYGHTPHARCTPEGLVPSQQYARARRPNFTIAQSEENFGTQLGQVRSWLSGDARHIEDARMQALMQGFQNYMSINNARQAALWQQQQGAGGIINDQGGVWQAHTPEWNQNVLGMTTTETTSGNTWLDNPWSNDPWTPEPEPWDDWGGGAAASGGGLMCDDGSTPDGNGCCAGETLEDLGSGWYCCPDWDPDGDCFPPLQ